MKNSHKLKPIKLVVIYWKWYRYDVDRKNNCIFGWVQENSKREKYKAKLKL